MDQYRSPHHHLPRYLYRVQYDGTNTHNDGQHISAADTTTIPSSTDEIRDSIVNQFTRANRIPTPYISLFSEREHAENWALKMSGEVYLLVISKENLEGVKLFRLEDLIRRLGIAIPYAAAQHQHGAWLALHQIPCEAIRETVDRSGIESAVLSRFEQIRDGFPYDSDDSDDEAACNNFNDDVVKTMEC